ncbi:irregular chiasm C-roughest protein-like [Palaemon carinicauda]|uniref:irregular chiasm C-roughest protein-like n=1 Tax=Palaemon carinicauda TaxID=392227 RepID=UPI0035B58273
MMDPANDRRLTWPQITQCIATSWMLWSMALLLITGQTQAQKRLLQSFANEPSPQTAVVGSTVVMPCRVINKVGELQWTRDDFGLGNERALYAFKRYQMIGSDEEGDFSLRISPVSLEDDAQFQCQVTGSGSIPGVRSQTARLTVYVPPESPEILQGSSVTVTEGAPVTLECVANGGKPAAEIQWQDNVGRTVFGDVMYTAEMMPDKRRSNAKSTLNFNAAREHHNAVFTCMTSNPALRDPLKAQVHLKVRYAPDVTISHDRRGYRDGQSAILTCSADANPSDVTYRWYKGGVLVPGINQTELEIANITRDSSLEDITCEVTNDIGTTKKVTRILIHYEPKFEHVPTDQYAGLGENVTLQCRVDASPEPDIVWIKDDRLVGEGPQLHVVASRSNVGAYQCVAQVDGFADVSATATIFLKGPPRIISEREQWGNQGETVLVECIVAAAPAPSISVTWTHHGKLVDLDESRFEEVQDITAKGVRHTLVIRDAKVTDFGPYKCSVHNEYGTDVAEILLDKRKTLPLLLLVCGVTGGVMLVLVVAMIVIMCAKKNASRHKGGKPYGLPEKTVGLQANDQNSSANESDLKVEFDQRTGSSMSNKEGELEGWGETEGVEQPSTPQYLNSANPYIFPDTFAAVPVKMNGHISPTGGLGCDNHASPSPVQHHTPSPTRGFLTDTHNGFGNLVGTSGVEPCQRFSEGFYPRYSDYERRSPQDTQHNSAFGILPGFTSTLGDYSFKGGACGTLPLTLQPSSRSNGGLGVSTFTSTVPRLGIPVNPAQYITSPKTQMLQGTLATHV